MANREIAFCVRIDASRIRCNVTIIRQPDRWIGYLLGLRWKGCSN